MAVSSGFVLCLLCWSLIPCVAVLIDTSLKIHGGDGNGTSSNLHNFSASTFATEQEEAASAMNSAKQAFDESAQALKQEQSDIIQIRASLESLKRQVSSRTSNMRTVVETLFKQLQSKQTELRSSLIKVQELDEKHKREYETIRGHPPNLNKVSPAQAVSTASKMLVDALKWANDSITDERAANMQLQLILKSAKLAQSGSDAIATAIADQHAKGARAEMDIGARKLSLEHNNRLRRKQLQGASQKVKEGAVLAAESERTSGSNSGAQLKRNRTLEASIDCSIPSNDDEDPQLAAGADLSANHSATDNGTASTNSSRCLLAAARRRAKLRRLRRKICGGTAPTSGKSPKSAIARGILAAADAINNATSPTIAPSVDIGATTLADLEQRVRQVTRGWKALKAQAEQRANDAHVRSRESASLVQSMRVLKRDAEQWLERAQTSQ